MVFTFNYPARKYERFTVEAVRSMVGQEFVAKLEDTPVGKGRILSAELLDEGRAVSLTVDWPDDEILKKVLSDESFSFIERNPSKG